MSGPGDATIEDDILKITSTAASQQGALFAAVPGLRDTDGIVVRYQMYTGDGTGADGQCVNLGANDMGGRNGEDGVAVGVALCFDEWANGRAEHGIQIFYNGEMLFEGRATCENQAGCAPVSYFNDATWHDVELHISPDSTGGAHVRFSLDRGLYGGVAVLAAYTLPRSAYIGFSGRTGGANNNHWVKEVSILVGPVLAENSPRPAALRSAFQFPSTVVENREFQVTGDASVSGDHLQITPAEGSQSGAAYRQVSGLSATDRLTVRYQMYTGDGSGADGQCVNVGENDMGGRNGEDGVTVGIAVCFDEWANSDAEHGIQIFYNGEMILEGRATCGNREG